MRTPPEPQRGTQLHVSGLPEADVVVFNSVVSNKEETATISRLANLCTVEGLENVRIDNHLETPKLHDMSLLLWFLTMFLAFTTTLYMMFPYLLHSIGTLVGSHIRSKTQERREALLDRFEKETKQLASKSRGRKSVDLDADWEEVEGKTQEHGKAQSLDEGSEQGQSWGGIVGFFHPFWYEY